ncbi:uncharacterized protein LOC143277474 [Babylonia areolata]|uniref:uncharacterized protein LOC143277474 n=1 Tax=Babylonia areolata TaxID=304850 RepID=UPI003FD18600
MSVLTEVNQTFDLKAPPTSSDLAELTKSLSLTHIEDDNGNSLHLVPTDLCTVETEDGKDSGCSSESGAEYDLADPIDNLTLYSEREVDSRVLEEFGGSKRSRATSGQRGEEEDVPPKRPMDIRPPPCDLPTVTSPPQEGNGGVMSSRQNWINFQNDVASNRSHVALFRSDATPQQGSSSADNGNKGKAVSQQRYTLIHPVNVPDRQGGAVWSQGSVTLNEGGGSVSNPWSNPAGNPRPPRGGTDLPTDVDADSVCSSLEEKNRKIEQIKEQLMAISGDTVSKAAGQSDGLQVGAVLVTGPTLPPPPGHSPAGPPPLTSPSQPTWFMEGGVRPWHRPATAAEERQTPCTVQGPPRSAAVPISLSDTCIGPPPLQHRALRPSVGSPLAVQGGGRGQGVVNGLVPTHTGGNRPAVAVQPIAAPAQPVSTVQDSGAILRQCSLTGQAPRGPHTGGKDHRVVLRQDSASSTASSAGSSTRSTPPLSCLGSGPIARTCLPSVGGCGAVIISHDATSPAHTPSPFSPSSSASGDQFAQTASSPPAALGSPRSTTSSNLPATSPYPAQSHVSPGVYSLPPTPESDCQSPLGKASQDFLTPGPWQATEQAFFHPGASSTSTVIGCPGLPTPPHGYTTGSPLTPAVSSSSSSSPPILSVSRLPSSQLCVVNGSVVAVVCSALPMGEGVGKVEEEGERKEEGGVDFEERVCEEVLDAVCDEHGEWVTDSYGDTILHSLSGMENERTAVEYARCLRSKPGFLRALNSYNKSLETPLYNAVCLGKLALVGVMLQLGADVNLLCRYGDQAHAPLHRAVDKGQTDMVDMLLRSDRIQLNARRGSDHCTALMVAVMRHVPGHPLHDRLDIIVKLMQDDDRLDLQARDPRSGKTALMMAIETKDIRVVDALLNDLDLDVARHLINMQNRAGNSAVHLAAGLRDISPKVKEHMLRQLIRLGGETNKKNNEGDTPREWAKHLIDRVARLR